MRLRHLFLCILFLPLLVACGSESASLRFNGEQALTLVREKPLPWDAEYLRSMVVMSRPACMSRYKFPPDDGNMGKVEVFDAGDGQYFLRDKLGVYRASIADCKMFLEPQKLAITGEFKGHFEVTETQKLRFVPAPKKPAPAPVPVPAPTLPATNVQPK